MNSFSFNPSDGFINTDSYPDPASGTAARTQLQSLHTQTQEFINDTMVPEINDLEDTVNNAVSRIGTAEDDIEALQTSVSSLSDTVTAFATLFTTAGLRLVVGGTTYAISVSNGTVTATEVQ